MLAMHAILMMLLCLGTKTSRPGLENIMCSDVKYKNIYIFFNPNTTGDVPTPCLK